MTAEVSEGSVQSGPLPVSQHSRQKGGEEKPKIYVGQFHIRQFQLRLFTRFIIRKFVTNFLWGAAGKGVKATFSVCLTFRGFPVGTAGPAAGDDGPFPHLRSLARIATTVAVKHFI